MEKSTQFFTTHFKEINAVFHNTFWMSFGCLVGHRRGGYLGIPFGRQCRNPFGNDLETLFQVITPSNVKQKAILHGNRFERTQWH